MRMDGRTRDARNVLGGDQRRPLTGPRSLTNRTPPLKQILVPPLARHLLVLMERRGITSLRSNSPQRTTTTTILHLNRTNRIMKVSRPLLGPFPTPSSVPLQSP